MGNKNNIDASHTIVDYLDSGTAIYHEEKGYSVLPSFVKGNPLNNQAYIEIVQDEYRESGLDLAADLVGELKKFLDDTVGEERYNIAQIKEKFGYFTFYYDIVDDDDVEELSSEKQMEKDIKDQGIRNIINSYCHVITDIINR